MSHEENDDDASNKNESLWKNVLKRDSVMSRDDATVMVQLMKKKKRRSSFIRGSCVFTVERPQDTQKIPSQTPEELKMSEIVTNQADMPVQEEIVHQNLVEMVQNDTEKAIKDSGQSQKLSLEAQIMRFCLESSIKSVLKVDHPILNAEELKKISQNLLKKEFSDFQASDSVNTMSESHMQSFLQSELNETALIQYHENQICRLKEYSASLDSILNKLSCKTFEISDMGKLSNEIPKLQSDLQDVFNFSTDRAQVEQIASDISRKRTRQTLLRSLQLDRMIANMEIGSKNDLSKLTDSFINELRQQSLSTDFVPGSNGIETPRAKIRKLFDQCS